MNVPVSRASLLARLGSARFDLLVIGGGIVGAGVARDAVMRGLAVALIEQQDFAGGTSSKTSKLIHGGLRYLEHGRLRLVYESVRERAVLRAIAPSLVHPLSILLPVTHEGARPMWKVRLGLSLYDVLAAGRAMRFHRMLSPRRAVDSEPSLSTDGLRAAGLFWDCQMDDARLCLANILQAVGFGAVCCNYVRMKMLLKSNGQLCGALAEDVVTGRSIEIQARIVVNATGPWSDGVRRLSDPGAAQRLAPTKGIHLILPAAVRQGLFVEARSDRRMIFVLPWGGYTLVGTTEGPVDHPLDALQATGREVDYLLTELNRALPSHRFSEDDIVATYAGARPLLGFSGTSSQASREHRIEVDDAGLISIMGGKYTTYRLMAKQTVDLVVRRERMRVDRSLTHELELIESMHPVTLEHWQALTRHLDPDLIGRLLTRYGAGTFHLLRLIDADPALSRAVCPHHELIEAELVYALSHELACTLTDVLARRTRIAWSSCQGLDAISRIAALMQTYGGLSVPALERQLEEYQQLLAQSLAFRGASPSVRQWSEEPRLRPSAL